jgi:hypothetical protein
MSDLSVLREKADMFERRAERARLLAGNAYSGPK